METMTRLRVSREGRKMTCRREQATIEVNRKSIVIIILSLCIAPGGPAGCTGGCGDYSPRADDDVQYYDADALIEGDSDEPTHLEESIPNDCIDEPLVREGNIVIKTRQDLAAIKGYTTINAKLLFDEPDEEFRSLDALFCLRSVESLEMVGTVAFNIHGISGIERVTGERGELGFYHSGPFKIPEFNDLTEVWKIGVSNTNITSLSGFNGLERLGWLSINSNPRLKSISGFNNLEEVVELINIDGEPNLESISGLEKLRSAGTLYLINLNGTRISAFKNLEILGNLIISDSSFTAEGAFERLHAIKRWFDFGGNNVKNMDEFSALKSIDEFKSADYTYIAISNNSELEDIQGLFNIKKVGSDEIWITDNPKLPTCQVERFIEHLRSLGWNGTAYIDGNDDDATCDP